jgi:aspartyl-tRNA(Asn)/glutamyl-tRNA(Gln) amidotransferase subunit A
MAEQDLLFMTAQQVAALIRRRKLSPVEITEAVLAQIERIAPLNAFVTVLHEQARAAACAAEQAVMRNDTLPPLHGVPVHVKDQVDTAGIRTTIGSAIFADNIPTRDDTLITQLRAAGAILVGKTRLPEFGNKGLTDGPSFGTTLNPWDTTRTCGGSSGAAHRAEPRQPSPPAPGRWRSERMAPVRSAFRPPAAASSATSRRLERCPGSRPSTPSATTPTRGR